MVCFKFIKQIVIFIFYLPLFI